LQANLNYEIDALKPEGHRNSLGFNILATAMF
jgi:hypothetical protein